MKSNIVKIKKESIPKSEKITNAIIKLFEKTITYYEYNYNEVNRCDLENSDLLHLIEFNNFSAVKMTKLYIELKNLRRKRRKLKNENETLIILYNLMKKHHQFLEDLKKASKEISKINDSFKKRKYTPRIRTDSEFGLSTVYDLKDKTERRA